MNVAQHAEQILAAWNKADPERFEKELDNALRSCEREIPASYLESERREVLECVVERLRTIRPPAAQSGGRQHPTGEAFTPQGLNVGFALLEHLRQRAAA